MRERLRVTLPAGIVFVVDVNDEKVNKEIHEGAEIVNEATALVKPERISELRPRRQSPPHDGRATSRNYPRARDATPNQRSARIGETDLGGMRRSPRGSESPSDSQLENPAGCQTNSANLMFP